MGFPVFGSPAWTSPAAASKVFTALGISGSVSARQVGTARSVL